MKLRTGFVSNSSSSSFVVTYYAKDKYNGDITADYLKLFDNRQSFSKRVKQFDIYFKYEITMEIYDDDGTNNYYFLEGFVELLEKMSNSEIIGLKISEYRY